MSAVVSTDTQTEFLIAARTVLRGVVFHPSYLFLTIESFWNRNRPFAHDFIVALLTASLWSRLAGVVLKWHFEGRTRVTNKPTALPTVMPTNCGGPKLATD